MNIQGRIIGYFDTVRALVAGRGCRSFLAVERLGQNPGHRCFPDTARTAEKKSMGHTPLGNGIAQRFDHMRLTGNFFKSLRPKFSG